MCVEMRQGIRSSGGLGSSSRVACHDCGNQAKRDCVYMRCRTCCKTKGFRCQTHVKSTWVPAYRRRHSHHHHQQLMFDASASQQHVELQPSLLLNPRRDNRQENPTPTSGLEEGLMFPREITSPAIFHCILVRSSDTNVVEQYAYKTTVTIGGHLFKGILYDQGPDQQQHTTPDPNHYLSVEAPTTSNNPPLEPSSPAFAMSRQRSAFPSPFQIPLHAASSNPACGTHVFFHQNS